MNDGAQALVSSRRDSEDGGVRSQRRREAVFLGGGGRWSFFEMAQTGKRNSSAEW